MEISREKSIVNLDAAKAAPATPPLDQASLAGGAHLADGEGHAADVNLRQLLGNPKITFVLGKRAR